MSNTPADNSLGGDLFEDVRQRVADSVSLRLAFFGVALFVLGATVVKGAPAAMLAIWGTVLAIVGIVGYAVVWYGRYR